MSELEQKIKKLEAEIVRLNEASRAKDEFIRLTNHELRTPLDIIRGHIDMVLKGDTGKVLEKTKEYLKDTLLGADRLTKLVDDMLDISRVETGRLKIAVSDIDLAGLLESTKKKFLLFAKEKDIALTLDLSPDLPIIQSDRTRILQIIDNLIGNSLKFTPPKGSVTISARVENSSVVISIRDTGIGIRPEDQDMLFTKFPQIEMGISREEKGAGLGLALAKQLVEILGGEIWAESLGLGKGATFSFRLPLSAP